MVKSWMILMILILIGCNTKGQNRRAEILKTKLIPSISKIEKQNNHPIFEGIPISFNIEEKGKYKSISIEVDPYQKVFKPTKKIRTFEEIYSTTLLEYYLKVETKELYDSLFFKGYIPSEMPVDFQLGPTPDLQFENLGSMGMGTSTHFYKVFRVKYIDRLGYDKGIRHLLLTNAFTWQKYTFLDEEKEGLKPSRWYLLNDINDQDLLNKVEDPVVKMVIDMAMRFDYEKAQYFFKSINWLEENQETIKELSAEEYKKLITLKKLLMGAIKPTNKYKFDVDDIFNGVNYKEKIIKQKEQLLWIKMEEVFQPTSNGYNEGAINFLFK